MRYLISGGKEDIPYVESLLMRTPYETLSVFYWILPDLQVFKDKKIVSTHLRDYFIEEMGQLLQDRGNFLGRTIWELYKDQTSLKSPGVPHYPIYGSDVKTEHFFNYPQECRPYVHKMELFDC